MFVKKEKGYLFKIVFVFIMALCAIFPCFHTSVQAYSEYVWLDEDKTHYDPTTGRTTQYDFINNSYPEISAFNLEDSLGVFEERSQDPHNLCWSFAGTRTLEVFLKKHFNANYDFSEAWISIAYERYSKSGENHPFDPNDHDIENYSYGGFAHVLAMKNAINAYGIATEQDVPYDTFNSKYGVDFADYNDAFAVYGTYANNIVSDLSYQNILLYHPYATTLPDKNFFVNCIKDYLYNFGALYTAVNMVVSTNSQGQEYINYPNLETDLKAPSSHALTIIGFDDNFDCGSSAEKGAFLMINSYGDNQKYLYLPYSHFDPLIEGNQAKNKILSNTFYLESLTYNQNAYVLGDLCELNPVGGTNPSDPTDPPTDPSDPTDPPTPPVDPENPTDPEEPSDPTDPGNPSDPSEPTDPSEPSDPEDPAVPPGSDDPEQPSEPTDPTPSDPQFSDRDLQNIFEIAIYVVGGVIGVILVVAVPAMLRSSKTSSINKSVSRKSINYYLEQQESIRKEKEEIARRQEELEAQIRARQQKRLIKQKFQNAKIVDNEEE